MIIAKPHEIREKIRALTAKIEQSYAEGKPRIESAVQRAARDVYRRQLRKLQNRKNKMKKSKVLAGLFR